MSKAICGIDCDGCDFKGGCGGCAETNGKPFGGSCMIASCVQSKDFNDCTGCESPCTLKQKLIAEFNALGIADMPKVTDLNALCGSYINLSYELPNGQSIKLLDDSRIYLGNQLHKEGSERCYGIIADENYIIVSEYGCNGSDAQIVLYKRR